MPLVVALGVARVARADDFDPRGRHHPPAHPPGPAGPHPPAPHGPAGPAPGVSPAVLLERYTKIVLAQPGAPFPLQRLAQLYRDRDGKLDALVHDLEARVAQPGPEQYAATVALAGVDKLDGRPDAAILAYQIAAGQKPTDPVAFLALAHLYQDRGDVGPAKTHFERALALQTVAPD